MVWGCFSGVWLSSLLPVKGNLNSSAYQDISTSSIVKKYPGMLKNTLLGRRSTRFETPSQKSRSHYKLQRGDQLHINVYVFRV